MLVYYLGPTFVMRHSWIILLMACGALGLGRYRLGVGMALWGGPRASGVLGVLWALPVAALLGLAWGRVVPQSPRSKLMRGALVFLGALGLLAASCAPESKFLPYPYIETCLTPGFDRKSFERLHTGMSTTEVEAVTGLPRFAVRPQPGATCSPAIRTWSGSIRPTTARGSETMHGGPTGSASAAVPS
jgi:hypothetical protein